MYDTGVPHQVFPLDFLAHDADAEVWPTVLVRIRAVPQEPLRSCEGNVRAYFLTTKSLLYGLTALLVSESRKVQLEFLTHDDHLAMGGHAMGFEVSSV